MDYFFREKNSLQLDLFQFFKINSLMAETIEKQFFKTKFLQKIAKFDNNLLNTLFFYVSNFFIENNLFSLE